MYSCTNISGEIMQVEIGHFVCNTLCQSLKANYISGSPFNIFGTIFTTCSMSNIQCRQYFNQSENFVGL